MAISPPTGDTSWERPSRRSSGNTPADSPSSILREAFYDLSPALSRKGGSTASIRPRDPAWRLLVPPAASNAPRSRSGWGRRVGDLERIRCDMPGLDVDSTPNPRPAHCELMEAEQRRSERAPPKQIPSICVPKPRRRRGPVADERAQNPKQNPTYSGPRGGAGPRERICWVGVGVLIPFTGAGLGVVRGGFSSSPIHAALSTAARCHPSAGDGYG
ncbi:hypothetical protein B2J93_9279 [Marssonina coronariae]|uniref:Uncharacterized protein n=1 Tax=Diplocarpon coronariae TaxID=2795749 RepID=A0A218ZH66_9HELO|nr:hypothetical protein B2J93_9279 [Marssonina coronariae]